MSTSASLPVFQPAAADQPAGPSLELDPRTYRRALGCVHCGLCLPACPTYTTTGHEADSPRGRIQLMRGLADGTISPTKSVVAHLDLCLDCRACETACPSGVVYHELIEETRERFAHDPLIPKAANQSAVVNFLIRNLFPHPTRLKLALLPARIMQKIGLYGLLRQVGLFNILPTQLRKMEQMLPPTGPLWPASLPARVAARNVAKPKLTVGFFQGCVGQVMFDKVNRMAVELLAESGAEVLVVTGESCCGAIHHHNGDHTHAQSLARRNIEAFVPASGVKVDVIVNTIAGCGAMLHEYDYLLRDDKAYADRAKDFASRVKDISEVLAGLGLPSMKFPVNATVTYHDACHLAHAQKLTAPPRKLLGQVPGLKLVALPDSDMCCGAAGTYNLTQPEMATILARRKLANIATTAAPTCVTGNVGCAMHIQSQAIADAQPLRVAHPVEILHEAVFGPSK